MSQLRLWVLDGHLEVPEPDLYKWGEFFGKSELRVVKQEWVENIWVSTVFLGINHNFGFGQDKRPLLYETMTFSNRRDFDQDIGGRWHTWAEAEKNHKRIVAEIRSHFGQGGSQ